MGMTEQQVDDIRGKGYKGSHIYRQTGTYSGGIPELPFQCEPEDKFYYGMTTESR